MKLLQWPIPFFTQQKASTLATPNYGYEKRQRELAKKKKKEEKLRAKTTTVRHGGSEQAPEAPDTHADAGLPSASTQQPG